MILVNDLENQGENNSAFLSENFQQESAADLHEVLGNYF